MPGGTFLEYQTQSRATKDLSLPENFSELSVPDWESDRRSVTRIDRKATEEPKWPENN
jgi:hypothetical protein